MASTKISAMPAATTLTGAELLAGVQSAANVKITANQLKTLVGGGVGGSTTQLQYNNAGAFGGVSGWTTNGSTALTGGASTTLAIGGATIGSDALAVTGTVQSSGIITSASSIHSNLNVRSVIDAGLISIGAANDVIFSRRAAASWQFGAADAAAPVAQTIGPQSVVAGTSNTNGANFTIRGSAGTGTGTGGSLLFQVATAGSTGSTQNAQVTSLMLAHDLSATFAGNITSAGNILAGAGNLLSWNGRVLMSAPNTTDLLLRDSSFASFGKIQLGGTGTGHPAINRNGTGIDIKLADGSAFTNIKGKLTTDNAYVGTPAVSTGTVIIYDSAGTALRVLVANP